jgi:hypothetical protein
MVLAIFTWISASASRKAADAATKEASATSDLAQQAREDRELAWRAILNIRHLCSTVTLDKGCADLIIVNHGNGPAFECTIQGYFSAQGLWGVKKNLIIAAHESSDLKLELDRTREGDDAFPDEAFTFPGQEDVERVGNVFVATYKDALGNLYRVAEGGSPKRLSVEDRSDHGRADFL